jgi:hypothetical protein
MKKTALPRYVNRDDGFTPYESLEYRAIKEFYGHRRAERSKVPLLHHIHEGVSILNAIGASKDARHGYMLHPLFQADTELYTVGYEYANVATNAVPVALAMEYRVYANAWLSDKVIRQRDTLMHVGLPTPGPNKLVKQMLIADKVQNKKDFERYHKGTHKRSDELDSYFDTWLEVLGVGKQEYNELVAIADSITQMP